MKTNQPLVLLEQIDKVLALGEKGLARVVETEDIEKRIRDFIIDSIDTDSEIGREYEKWTHSALWKTQTSNGFAARSHLAPIISLRGFLTRFMDTQNIKATPTQEYIPTGHLFTGRRILREILSEATNEIDIQDNYLDIGVLPIFEPYLIGNPKIKLRLLTSNRISNSFKADFNLFAMQFENVEIKINNQTHGRFLILDKNSVYSVGSSLKDLGLKADVLSKIVYEKTTKQILKDYEEWWIDGSSIS